MLFHSGQSAPTRQRAGGPAMFATLLAAVAVLIGALVCAGNARASAPLAVNKTPLIGQWQLVPTVTGELLRDVYMVTASDGWAVGDNGTVLHYNGASWQPVNISSTFTLIDVFMLNATEGYIAAWTDYGSAIYHYDGVSWTLAYNSSLSLSRIGESSPNNVWAVGLNTSLHYDGNQWNVVPIPVERQVFAVNVLGDNDVWAFGQYEPVSGHGLILHYTDGAWHQIQSPAPQTIFDGFFTSPSDGWAVGTAVTTTYVFRYDGIEWRRAYTNNLGLFRLYMFSPNDGWGVGGSEGVSSIAYFNGTDFAAVPCPTNNFLSAIWMSSRYDGWIVGDRGTLIHYTDSTPTPTSSATTTPIATATPSPTRASTVTGTATPVGTPSATATPCSIGFTDVLPTDFYYQAVRYLYCNGVISGYGDNTFRPGNNATRGQLSKIVVLAEGWAINTQGGPHFTDVATTNPFYAFIETAFNRGVISGYADGTFRWGNNITRGQLCKIVVLAEGWAINTAGGPHFTDVPASDPFYALVETAFNHQIISGYADGTFRPGNNATRGQISKIVYAAITAP